MLQFTIHNDSDVPASKQLLDQIQFAIASRQFNAGQRLPSLRQMERMTGLHRNTISKVYHQLETQGLVESIAGSGIYVKADPPAEPATGHSPLLAKYPHISGQICQALDQLLASGCTLSQARELFLAEVDWRIQCSAQLVVTVPAQDLGVGRLMAQELEQTLAVAVHLIPLEELESALANIQAMTILTSRYFLQQAEAIATLRGMRVLPVDIYDYSTEMKLVTTLPEGSSVGLVSLSSGILRVAAMIIYSLRGNDLRVVTAQVGDRRRLQSLIRTCQTIICDPPSTPLVEQMIRLLWDDLIRKPQIIPSKNYLSEESLDLLRRELDL